MTDAGNNSNTPPPIGKQHQKLISIQQPQRVSLTKGRELLISIQQAQRVTLNWVKWIRNTVAAWVDTATSWVRQGPGRPPVYDYSALDEIARDLLLIGVDKSFARFAERLRNEGKTRGIEVPEYSQRRNRFKPMWDAARAQIAKK
jgi:hypothetical protein